MSTLTALLLGLAETMPAGMQMGLVFRTCCGHAGLLVTQAGAPGRPSAASRAVALPTGDVATILYSTTHGDSGELLVPEAART